MIHWSQGLFGFVASLQPVLDVFQPYVGPSKVIATSNTPPQTPPAWDGDLSIPSLMAAYRAGLSPVTVVNSLYKTIQAYGKENYGVWIYLQLIEKALKAA